MKCHLHEDSGVSSMDDSRAWWRRGGGRSACLSAYRNERRLPLPSLHHTVPYSPPSFPQSHTYLIYDVCEDEAAQKSCLNHPVIAVSLHATASHHPEMLLKWTSPRSYWTSPGPRINPSPHQHSNLSPWHPTAGPPCHQKVAQCSTAECWTSN